jgi:hypothetical protein
MTILLRFDSIRFDCTDKSYAATSYPILFEHVLSEYCELFGVVSETILGCCVNPLSVLSHCPVSVKCSEETLR